MRKSCQNAGNAYFTENKGLKYKRSARIPPVALFDGQFRHYLAERLEGPDVKRMILFGCYGRMAPFSKRPAPGRTITITRRFIEMRSNFALAALMILASSSVFAQDLSTDKGKLSYAMGWNFGAELKSRPDTFDASSVTSAITDAMADREPQLEVAEMQQLLQAFQQQVQQEQLAMLQQLAAENQTKADEFLAQNRGKTGIVALPSGIQYRIIEEGEGSRPSLTSTVRVHYRSSKIDGREMDSSFARGTPEEFVVSNVLKGWQEVLPLMKTGATWQVFVPPELAFGQRGNPPAVGPNEALQFDLKLVEIVQP